MRPLCVFCRTKAMSSWDPVDQNLYAPIGLEAERFVILANSLWPCNMKFLWQGVEIT